MKSPFGYACSPSSFFILWWCLSVLGTSDMSEEPLKFPAESLACPLVALPCPAGGCCPTGSQGCLTWDTISLAWPEPKSPPWVSWSQLQPQAFGASGSHSHSELLRKHYLPPGYHAIYLRWLSVGSEGVPLGTTGSQHSDSVTRGKRWTPCWIGTWASALLITHQQVRQPCHLVSKLGHLWDWERVLK